MKQKHSLSPGEYTCEQSCLSSFTLLSETYLGSFASYEDEFYLDTSPYSIINYFLLVRAWKPKFLIEGLVYKI